MTTVATRASADPTQRRLRRFDRDGFLVVPGALDPDQVRRYYERGQTLYRQIGKGVHSAFLFASAVQRDSCFLPLIDHPPILELLVRLLGPCIQLLGSEVWIRPREAEAIPWHRDGGFLMRHLHGLVEVKVQYFLSDVPAPESGNLVFARGSHRRVPPDVDDVPRWISAQRQEMLFPKAGDVAIWSAGTWHRVEPNQVVHERVSIILTYGLLWLRKYDYVGIDQMLARELTPLQSLLLADGMDPFVRGEYYFPSDVRRRVALFEGALGPLPGLPLTGIRTS